MKNKIYTKSEAQVLCQKYLERCNIVKHQKGSQLSKDIQIAKIMTEMENLGIPLLMKWANSWANKSEGNSLILQTYQFIGDLRDI